MLTLRRAGPRDIGQVRQIEKEYYGGFACPQEILESWIRGLPENFIVVEENGRIVGFVFFEYLDEIRALPFVHELQHKKNGPFVYVSDVGIGGEFQDSEVLQKLLDKLVEKSKNDGCKKVVWVTGSRSRHDKIELKLLAENGFARMENVGRWEAAPGYFVDDHFIWVKEIRL